MPEIPFKATILGFYFVISEVVISTNRAPKKGQRQTLLTPLIRDKPKAPDLTPRPCLSVYLPAWSTGN